MGLFLQLLPDDLHLFEGRAPQDLLELHQDNYLDSQQDPQTGPSCDTVAPIGRDFLSPHSQLRKTGKVTQTSMLLSL